VSVIIAEKKQSIKKNPSRFGNLMSIVAFIGGLIIVAVASLNLLSDSREYAAAREEYAMLREIYTGESADHGIAYKPDGSGKQAASKSAVKTERAKKSIAALTGLNADFTGWMTITGTSVSYPVVRGKDNDTYLNTTFRGEKNASGAIFMDYRCANGFDAPACFLYGHNMKDGTMFAPLIRYLETDFMINHPEIIITTTKNESLTYRVFDARMTDTSDAAFSINLNDGAGAREFFTGSSDGAARALILSTCPGGGNKDRRLLIYSSLVGVR